MYTAIGPAPVDAGGKSCRPAAANIVEEKTAKTPGHKEKHEDYFGSLIVGSDEI
ncbi:MAG: hypothetical protein KFF77_06675 [Bacteroidetes bacterium]|nr:hypothetical protein [Bacteroidota bacterium]